MKFNFNIKETTIDYYPFGMEIAGRSFSSVAYRFGFNGQQKVDEIAGFGNINTAMFWEYDTRIGRRWNQDPVVKRWESPYACFNENPIWYMDPLGLYGNPKRAEKMRQRAVDAGLDPGKVYQSGKDWGFNTPIKDGTCFNYKGTQFGTGVTLYITTLPNTNLLNAPVMAIPTHSFLNVYINGEPNYFAYGYAGNGSPIGGSQLKQVEFDQDWSIINGDDGSEWFVKAAVSFKPTGKTREQFARDVLDIANSFGQNQGITYSMLTMSETSGNCNTSTTTILTKAGVEINILKNLSCIIPGINWGLGETRPWTKSEQENAVNRARKRGEVDYNFYKKESEHYINNNFFYQ